AGRPGWTGVRERLGHREGGQRRHQPRSTAVLRARRQSPVGVGTGHGGRQHGGERAGDGGGHQPRLRVHPAGVPDRRGGDVDQPGLEVRGQRLSCCAPAVFARRWDSERIWGETGMTSTSGKTPAQPVLAGKRPRREVVLVAVFITAPMLALLCAVPFAWGWGLGWTDIALGVVFYCISGLGISVGYHRYFTHGSFKARTPLRVLLAVAGSLAMQGPVIRWVS